MSTKRSKFDFLSEERQQRDAEQPAETPAAESAQPSNVESAQDRKRTSAQDSIERRPSGQRIRADLLRAIKILAAETDTPQYVLIEEALEQYLERKRTR
jgi:hypothetical protein